MYNNTMTWKCNRVCDKFVVQQPFVQLTHICPFSRIVNKMNEINKWLHVLSMLYPLHLEIVYFKFYWEESSKVFSDMTMIDIEIVVTHTFLCSGNMAICKYNVNMSP